MSSPERFTAGFFDSLPEAPEKVYPWSGAPEPLVDGATRGYLNGLDPSEAVLVILDDSVLGSGRRGIALTDKRVLWNLQGTGELDLAALKEVRATPNIIQSTLQLNDIPLPLNAASRADLEILVRYIDGLVRALGGAAIQTSVDSSHQPPPRIPTAPLPPLTPSAPPPAMSITRSELSTPPPLPKPIFDPLEPHPHPKPGPRRTESERHPHPKPGPRHQPAERHPHPKPPRRRGPAGRRGPTRSTNFQIAGLEGVEIPQGVHDFFQDLQKPEHKQKLIAVVAGVMLLGCCCFSVLVSKDEESSPQRESSKAQQKQAAKNEAKRVKVLVNEVRALERAGRLEQAEQRSLAILRDYQGPEDQRKKLARLAASIQVKRVEQLMQLGHLDHQRGRHAKGADELELALQKFQSAKKLHANSVERIFEGDLISKYREATRAAVKKGLRSMDTDMQRKRWRSASRIGSQLQKRLESYGTLTGSRMMDLEAQLKPKLQRAREGERSGRRSSPRRW